MVIGKRAKESVNLLNVQKLLNVDHPKTSNQINVTLLTAHTSILFIDIHCQVSEIL